MCQLHISYERTRLIFEQNTLPLSQNTLCVKMFSSRRLMHKIGVDIFAVILIMEYGVRC